MITREQIRTAEAQAASHAAVFQIRCLELEQAAGPISRAIASAALRHERAALDFAGARLATIRKYAAYEGIAGEERPQAPQPFSPATVDNNDSWINFTRAADRVSVADSVYALEEQAAPVELEQDAGAATTAHNTTYHAARDNGADHATATEQAHAAYTASIDATIAAQDVDARSVECPKCGANPGERCNKQGRPQTRNHDARVELAQATAAHTAATTQAELDAATDQLITIRRRPGSRLPGGADNSRSGRFIYAREEAKHTPPQLRTPAQEALIQYPNVYARTLETDHALKAAESTGHKAAIEYALVAREEAHAAHDRTYRLAYSAV